MSSSMNNTLKSKLRCSHVFRSCQALTCLKFFATLFVIGIIVLFPRGYFNSAAVNALAELPTIEIGCPSKD